MGTCTTWHNKNLLYDHSVAACHISRVPIQLIYMRRRHFVRDLHLNNDTLDLPAPSSLNHQVKLIIPILPASIAWLFDDLPTIIFRESRP
jgi:hypothetical protein